MDVNNNGRSLDARWVLNSPTYRQRTLRAVRVPLVKVVVLVEVVVISPSSHDQSQ
jgi:hypothetical protein